MDLMNRVFDKYLDKFVIVFIDNILVFTHHRRAWVALEDNSKEVKGVEVVCQVPEVQILA